MGARIPFNRPCLIGKELDYVRSAVELGHISTGGTFTDRAVEILVAAHDAADVLLTTSCTDALEMTAMLTDIGPGDAVIVPSFTFTSTALAFARQGARLRFVDIESATLGIDPAGVAAAFDDDVKVVVAVHYAGVACDLEGLGRVLEGTSAVLVEDNAHGLFGTCAGKPLGTFGRFSTLSFHETKNITCGEGGALVLNDADDIDAAHVLLDKGTNRRSFLEGRVDKYTWQGQGSSFGMSDMLAAFLVAQLEEADVIQERRGSVAQQYRALLEPEVERLGITLPVVPPRCTPAHHMFYVLLPAAELRPRVLGRMSDAGVHGTFHYVPLHSSPAGRRFSDYPADCPVTDDISARLVRLPFFNDLSVAEVERVVATFVAAVDAG
jgi:dTDP-4-amino-4,6-dideoxygalactose transaminase